MVSGFLCLTFSIANKKIPELLDAKGRSGSGVNKLFSFSGDYLLSALRDAARASGILEELNAPESEVGLRALGRGAAQATLNESATLAQILKAGGWKSPAFLACGDLDSVADAAAAAEFLE